jgi:hypothetical protein
MQIDLDQSEPGDGAAIEMSANSAAGSRLQANLTCYLMKQPHSNLQGATEVLSDVGDIAEGGRYSVEMLAASSS